VPDIHIIREHNLGLEQARDSATNMARDLAEQFSISTQWNANTLTFARPGVDGEIQVEAARIVIQVRLGFMVSLFRAGIEQSIHEHLDQLLGVCRT